MLQLASISSWFSGNETLIQQIMIYALLAFSVQIALRAGIFSLAGIGFYGIGSYTAALLVKDHWPAIGAIAAAVVLTIIVSWLLAALLVRLRDLYLAMATVAFDLMIGVIALNWTKLTGGPLGVIGIPPSVSTLAIFLTVIVSALALILLERGTIGRTLVAIREDEQLARSLAVNTNQYRRFAFVLSAVFGCIAGCFHALLFITVEPGDAGFNLIVLALTMVIIGGFGSWKGALVGAILLTWVPYELTSIGQWWNVIYGGVMIGMATFIPGGLLSIMGLITGRGRGLGPKLRGLSALQAKAPPDTQPAPVRAETHA
jgi:branched-chain amino acid transport system permease protein